MKKKTLLESISDHVDATTMRMSLERERQTKSRAFLERITAESENEREQHRLMTAKGVSPDETILRLAERLSGKTLEQMRNEFEQRNPRNNSTPMQRECEARGLALAGFLPTQTQTTSVNAAQISPWATMSAEDILKNLRTFSAKLIEASTGPVRRVPRFSPPDSWAQARVDWNIGASNAINRAKKKAGR